MELRHPENEKPILDNDLLGTFNEKTSVYKEIVTIIHIIIKTSQLHDIDNVALKTPLNKLYLLLASFLKENNEVMIAAKSGCLFVEDEKIRVDAANFTVLTALMEEMNKRGTGGIIFEKGLTPNDLKNFFVAFNNYELLKDEPFNNLALYLKTNNSKISITQYVEEDHKQFTTDKKVRAKKTYFKTLAVVDDAMESVSVKQVLNIKNTKKVVQKLVDQILQEESILLGLTTLRCYDEYTFNHCVNVCILAISVGRQMGLNKQELSDLGIAALFHDIGKGDIPKEILNKPSEFTPAEWEVMRRHPIYGVKKIITLKGINLLALRILEGAFEHHLNYDLSGYPRLTEKKETSLFGRVITIVDCYDALTSARVYNRIPFPPDTAVKYMLEKSGTAFDPLLMKIFVKTIGLYPIGTFLIVEKKDKSKPPALGLVTKTNSKDNLTDRPLIRLLKGTNFKPQEEAYADLSDTGENGDFVWNILKTVNPHVYNLKAANILA